MGAVFFIIGWFVACVLCAIVVARVLKLPYKNQEEADMARAVTIKVKQSPDALRFWVVQIGGNGETMWTTEQYTRLSSAKRAARAQYNRMKHGAAKLDLSL